MIHFVLIGLLQCALLASGQVCLKFAMQRMMAFSWTGAYFKALLTNGYLALAGVFFMSSTILWMKILRTYPLSLAYPFTGVAYVFGMLAALLIFQETIPVTRWIGVALIIGGVFFLVRQ